MFETKHIYCNFEKDKGLHDFFKDLTPATIIKKLSLYKRKEIFPENTLIIFDEIQACPEAITSLKYFNEEANNYHIIALESLLGVSVNRGNFSFPVGKVQFMTLYPLDFEEYLTARGEQGLIDLIRECYEKDVPLDSAFHERALDYYKEYLFVGGMPEAIVNENDYEMLLVINKYRPLTRTGADAVEVMREIEDAGKIKFTGIVNNSNLGDETTAEDVLSSQEYAADISARTGLPIVMTTVKASLLPELTGKIADMFPLSLYVKQAWARGC